MSTRAIIWFQNNESDANEHGTFVYAHDGGDPRFVLKDLKEAHDLSYHPVLENTRVRHRRQPIEKLARRHLNQTNRRRRAVAAG